MPAWLGEGPLQGHRLLAVSSHGRRGKGALGPFTGAFISFLRDFLVLWWFKNLPANVGALVLSLAQELGSPMQWDS